MAESKVESLGRRQLVGFKNLNIDKIVELESENVKVTFADGSSYYQGINRTVNAGKYAIKNYNTLFLDKECTQVDPVTRKEKLEETKHLLNKGESN